MMQINNLLSDDAILAELGERVSRCRLDRRMTQAQLAEQAGIGKRTVERLEAGTSTQLVSVIRVLRVLELLGNLEQAIPATGPRPIDLLERKGKVRQRASSARDESADEPWAWKDE